MIQLHYLFVCTAIISSASEPCTDLEAAIADVFPNHDVIITRLQIIRDLEDHTLTEALIDVKDHARSI